MCTFKPLDEEILHASRKKTAASARRRAPHNRRLGSACAEVLSEKLPTKVKEDRWSMTVSRILPGIELLHNMSLTEAMTSNQSYSAVKLNKYPQSAALTGVRGFCRILLFMQSGNGARTLHFRYQPVYRYYNFYNPCSLLAVDILVNTVKYFSSLYN
jgi:hypothetical protein